MFYEDPIDNKLFIQECHRPKTHCIVLIFNTEEKSINKLRIMELIPLDSTVDQSSLTLQTIPLQAFR